MPPTFRPSFLGDRRTVRQQSDQRRGTAAERGYSSEWARASKLYLRQNPLCAYCDLDGRATLASCTDHLYPQRQYEGVFWERKWWVAACDECHSGFKQAVERRGKAALDDLARQLGREVLI